MSKFGTVILQFSIHFQPQIIKLLPEDKMTLYNVGVGRADVTGPAAEVSFCSISALAYFDSDLNF